MAKIRIVLVGTTHPGNIGAAARAMKNMGISRLVLVKPKQFPADRATWRAASAADVLEQATVVNTLGEGIAGCGLVIGTSARERTIPWALVSPREAARESIAALGGNEIALVFGREDRGLTNAELQQCQMHLTIPTSAEYSSLNLAAAVQVVCYELRCALLEVLDQAAAPGWDQEYATVDEMEHLYQHLEQVMTDVRFFNPAKPRQLPARVRRLLAKARLDKMEAQIVRGFLAGVQKYGGRDTDGNNN